jgi:hypothetical protein
MNVPYMPNLAHRNHYVCQASQRRWSEDGVNVWAYSTLVSHAAVPLWKRRAISGIAYENDLYTSSCGDWQEVDDFERWINAEYEQHAFGPLESLVRGGRVSASDWESISRFVAAQDVRTPTSFLQFKKLYDEHAPEILEELVEEIVRLRRTGQPIPKPDGPPEGFTEAFRLKLRQNPSGPNAGVAELEVNVASRKLWLASQRHVLGRSAQLLSAGRWSVFTPHGDDEWVLTDHPVLRLKWYGPERYDFEGGWARPGGEIMMPVSPCHLLYMQVGTRVESRLTLSLEKTSLIQRLLAERAHRWIFATEKKGWVTEARPRLIDASLFFAEKSAWSQWAEKELEAEARVVAP